MSNPPRISPALLRRGRGPTPPNPILKLGTETSNDPSSKPKTQRTERKSSSNSEPDMLDVMVAAEVISLVTGGFDS